MDEYIFMEGDEGNMMYFISSGKVCVIHKASHTYLTDLFKYDYFGEIAFFSELKRSCSIMSLDYTDMTYI